MKLPRSPARGCPRLSGTVSDSLRLGSKSGARTILQLAVISLASKQDGKTDTFEREPGGFFMSISE